MQLTFSLLTPLVLVLVCQSYGQNNEVCLSIPPGPAGPPGPVGPPGPATECGCNETKIREELESQKETVAQTVNSTNNLTDFLINTDEIREIFNEEWRKKNNCPIGLADGRIPDDVITSSSVFNNNSIYAPKWARLDSRPSLLTGSSGAWLSKQLLAIRNLTCSGAFYRYGRLSSSLSHDLIQTVWCPPNCRTRYSSGVNVYGTSEYRDTSAICRSAIHYGQITDKGGIVTIKRKPRKKFVGSLQHRLQSQSYSSTEGSFSFLSKNLLEWIQVDFKSPKLLTGVVTQGRPTSKEEWVQSFLIKYGNSEDDLLTINNNGTDTIFLANTDMHSHVTNMFREPIRARYVRLLPLTWHEKIALRLEYLTC